MASKMRTIGVNSIHVVQCSLAPGMEVCQREMFHRDMKHKKTQSSASRLISVHEASSLFEDKQRTRDLLTKEIPRLPLLEPGRTKDHFWITLDGCAQLPFHLRPCDHHIGLGKTMSWPQWQYDWRVFSGKVEHELIDPLPIRELGYGQGPVETPADICQIGAWSEVLVGPESIIEGEEMTRRRTQFSVKA